MEKESISIELARVHAHLCGDGSVFIYKTSQKGRVNAGGAGYYNNNQRLLENFRRDFSKLFGVKMKMIPNRQVTISSIRIYKELMKKFGSFGSRKWRIPDSIKIADEGIKLGWLNAFF